MKTTLTPTEFFYEHAGYSYDPKTQTPEQGRQQCAELLARHEREACELGFYFKWEVDTDTDSSDFDDSDEPWSLWACQCHSFDGEHSASLSGIDFGRDGTPYGDSYRRVVEAQLAGEVLGNL